MRKHFGHGLAYSSIQWREWKDVLAGVSSHRHEHPRPSLSYNSGSSTFNNSLGKSLQIFTGMTSCTDTHPFSLPSNTPQLNGVSSKLLTQGKLRKLSTDRMHTFQNPLLLPLLLGLEKKSWLFSQNH